MITRRPHKIVAASFSLKSDTLYILGQFSGISVVMYQKQVKLRDNFIFQLQDNFGLFTHGVVVESTRRLYIMGTTRGYIIQYGEHYNNNNSNNSNNTTNNLNNSNNTRNHTFNLHIYQSIRGHCGSITCLTQYPTQNSLPPSSYLVTMPTYRGPYIASGGEDGLITIWDSITLIPLCIHNRSINPIIGLEFSPDGQLLASFSRDSSTIDLINVHTRSYITSIDIHRGGSCNKSLSHETGFIVAITWAPLFTRGAYALVVVYRQARYSTFCLRIVALPHWYFSTTVPSFLKPIFQVIPRTKAGSVGDDPA